MVYYRKYRPQTIEELDSSKVRETLTAVLSSKNIPHAFLFTGPKGLGKTSTARIVAKIVNCQQKKKGSIDPCNTCDTCLSITNGSNIDVLEIDGASNRGIDEIRDLRDKVKLAPSSLTKKVYIIDEVHMLTTEAFNALLKTIEEPPSHVMFVFATTEPQKVPATILSRCFHVAFPKATEEDIVRSLSRIVSGEKLQIDKAALVEIARLADGGFRDAAKILEELVAVAGEKKIDVEFIEHYYKTTNIVLQLTDFLAYLQARNTREAIHKIHQIVDQGTDIKFFISQILEKLDTMLLAYMGIGTDIASFPENIRFDIAAIKQLTELLSETYQKTKYAVIPQLPLELAVIEWCQKENQELRIKNQENVILNGSEGSQAQDNGVDSGQARVTSLKKDSSSLTQIDKTTIKSGPSIDEIRKKEQTLKVRSIIDGTKPSSASKAPDESIQHEQHSLSDNTNDVKQLMENIIYKVKPHNHSLAGILRGCDIHHADDKELVFQTAYKFHKERLQDAKSLGLLETAIKEITGKQIRILVELKG